MSIVSALLAGLLQGLTEFLPVSSMGHLGFLTRSTALTGGAALLFIALLHLSSLVALILDFRKDLRTILRTVREMGADLIYNLQLYLRKNRLPQPPEYKRIVTSTYRRLTVMVILSMIPTVLLGFLGRRLVVLSLTSPLMPGIGMLLTGVFLLVVDSSQAKGYKTPRNAGYETAMWVGIAQGLSVFPGLSRCGLTLGTGLFCGFSRKMALRYSYLISIPAILGAVLAELPAFGSAELSAADGGCFFLGMVVCGAVSYLVIRQMKKLTAKLRLRSFALYSFAIGALILSMSVG